MDVKNIVPDFFKEERFRDQAFTLTYFSSECHIYQTFTGKSLFVPNSRKQPSYSRERPCCKRTIRFKFVQQNKKTIYVKQFSFVTQSA